MPLAATDPGLMDADAGQTARRSCLPTAKRGEWQVTGGLSSPKSPTVTCERAHLPSVWLPER